MSWLSVSDSRLFTLWPGALDHDEAARAMFLDAAREQCETYLGEDLIATASEEIPARWLLAQALQAKALSQSGLVNQNDEFGGYGETFSAFPMDWKIKNLLRPENPLATA